MVLPKLSVIDYVVLVILLLSSGIIGGIFGFFRPKAASSKEYFLANGGMGVFPTALSIIVSFLSAIGLLGNPSEIYMLGTMFFYQALAWSIASMISAFIFMPKFREMNFTSAYEYLEKRFNGFVRTCVSMTFTVYMFIYMALVVYAPSLALSQTTGLNRWLSVVSIGFVGTFYSAVGGMKAIIWADVLQALVMYIGVLIPMIYGLNLVGGIRRAFSIASQGGRVQFNNISIDPRASHTVWSLLIGSSSSALLTYGFNQMQIQRYMCVRSTRGAQMALFINAIGVSILIILSCLLGVILYAYYVGCDPFTAGNMSSPDQIFPYFIMDALGHKKGIPGLFLACVFSGALSTISSGLNSLAAVIVEDIYKGMMRRQLDHHRQGIVLKLLSIVIGVIIILLTYIVSHLGSLINAAVGLSSALCGPIMGVFFLGFFFPHAEERGALAGFFISLALQFWILIGAQITKNKRGNNRLPLSISNCTSVYNTTSMPMIQNANLRPGGLIGFYSVNYMWYTPIAVGTVLIVGIIVSYFFNRSKKSEIDSKLIIRPSDIYRYCFSPASMQT